MSLVVRVRSPSRKSSFADIQPVEVPALPPEQHVAEKLHAYTRSYGQNHPSSRVKNIVDLVLIKRYLPLSAERLRSALAGTFEARHLHSVPVRLPHPPKEWAVPYRKLAREVGIEPDLPSGHAEAAALVDPVLEGMTSGHWIPSEPPGSSLNLRQQMATKYLGPLILAMQSPSPAVP